MLFKNAKVYHITSPLSFDPQALESMFQQHALTPCRAFETQRIGWTPIFGREGVLSYPAESRLLITMTCQQKLLPPAVIQEQWEDKVVELEKKLGKDLSKKEKKQLKDEVTNELLPQAFCRSQKVSAFIDFKNNRLVIGSKSTKSAEQMIDLLIKTIDGFKVSLFEGQDVSQTLSKWLGSSEYPKDWVILDRCTLTNTSDQSPSVIKCQGHDLMSDAIQKILQQGATTQELAFAWQERMEFNLSDELIIQSIKYPQYQKGNDQDSEIDQQVADFIYSSQLISELIDQCQSLFMTKQPAHSSSQKEPSTTQTEVMEES